MKAMDTAATGMDAQVTRIDTVSNNLANANTAGFKESQVDFADLMYEHRKSPGAARTQETRMPTGLEIGSGVEAVSTLKIFDQGSVKKTGGDLDMAIKGSGFFQVQGPNGQVHYTRDGNFRVNSEGQVVNSQGYRLTPAITIPDNAASVQVGSDGTVSVINEQDNTQTQVGTIQLVDFVNPGGLKSEGGNLYAETEASGPPQVGTPGRGGLGEIKQGYVEESNVDVVGELVDLIGAQRTYELNSKVVKAGARILQATNQLVR